MFSKIDTMKRTYLLELMNINIFHEKIKSSLFLEKNYKSFKLMNKEVVNYFYFSTELIRRFFLDFGPYIDQTTQKGL